MTPEIIYCSKYSWWQTWDYILRGDMDLPVSKFSRGPLFNKGFLLHPTFVALIWRWILFAGFQISRYRYLACLNRSESFLLNTSISY